MTNKTEKQFFDTFGIEERELDYPDNFTYFWWLYNNLVSFKLFTEYS